MYLYRFATIRLMRPPPRAMGRWTYVATNGVEVVSVDITGIQQDLTDQALVGPGTRIMFEWPYEHDKVRVAVYATVDAGPPQRMADRLAVPEGPRRSAEVAIAEYADVLAVAHQCKRVIRSPQPAVAVAPSWEGEREVFAGVTGLINPNGGNGDARVMPPVRPGDLAQAFADRLDGLAMLADSLSEDTAIARARELFRLFERAFKCGPSRCVGPLAAFLSSAPRHDASQYSADEVRYWLEQLRAEATHADRRERFARGADVSPFLGRIEYAAYDVLLNKEKWRHASATRRDRLRFMSVPGPNRLGTVVLHPGATLGVDWLDPFGVHAIDWESNLRLLDDSVWRMPGQGDA